MSASEKVAAAISLALLTALITLTVSITWQKRQAERAAACASRDGQDMALLQACYADARCQLGVSDLIFMADRSRECGKGD